MTNPSLDKQSLKILRELQANSRIPSAELAERVAMSTSPCWRRQKELEETGVIERYVALVDRRKVGLPVCCFLHISLTGHTEGTVKTFEEAMNLRPEVLECYEVTGSFDYLVKLVFASMDGYHDFLHNVLVKLPGISQVNTSVALREVKYDTALPI
jgi:Lrp/AsnC family leucine-responsive transcriptional regulator